MDLHNNAIGRRIGQIAKSGGGYNYILDTCLREARFGFLWYLTRDDRLVRWDSYGGPH
jgi:hypothetical protein